MAYVKWINIYQKNLLVKLHLFSLVEPWWAWQFEMIRGTEVICQNWCAYEEREMRERPRDTYLSLFAASCSLPIVHNYRVLKMCWILPLVAICHSIYSQLLLFGCPKILCSYSLLGSITAQLPSPPPSAFYISLGLSALQLMQLSKLSVCVCLCVCAMTKQSFAIVSRNTLLGSRRAHLVRVPHLSQLICLLIA